MSRITLAAVRAEVRMHTLQKDTHRALKRLRKAQKRAGLPEAPEVRVEFDCAEPWEQMAVVAEGLRHCARCDADVHDLVGLDAAQLAALVRAHGGRLCAQVVARSDGRVVFGECTETLRNMRGGISIREPEGE